MMTSVQPTELQSFFRYVISVLDRLGIPYMVVGGFAAIFYGEPRLTIDVDIVADIQLGHIGPFAQAFPIPDYYVSEEGIRDSLIRSYPFNVIHPSTGAKVDIVPLSNDPFTRLAFQRRQRLVVDPSGQEAYFITEEDIVIAKLIAFRETGSDKHHGDARGILLLQWDRLNLDRLRRAAQGAGVIEHFERLVALVRRDLE
jgi:hypothetical protein